MDIQIFLRDKNGELAKAWSKIFSGYANVDVSCGDIFDLKADAIISPANSFGFMDGGIDLAYTHYFGLELQEALQNKIRTIFYGELPVGLATIIETRDKVIKYLVSCPTMRVPENIANTVNAYLAFRAGLIEVLNFNKNNPIKISSILCPGLGTLTGRISSDNCAKQMKYAYDSIFYNKHKFPNKLYVASEEHKLLKNKD